MKIKTKYLKTNLLLFIKSKLRLLLLVWIPFTISCQYNLIPNPSFEICSNCNDSYIEFILSTGLILPGWSNPNNASPDFISVPSQNWMPFDTICGNNFIGHCLRCFSGK